MTISSIRAAGLLLMAGAGAALTHNAAADDTFYYGKWKITDAVVAPWVEAGRTADPAEQKALLGKIIVLTATSVDGPGAFPCSKPQYEMLKGGPDMLFQGTFGEMHAKDVSADPQKLAEQVGFTGADYRTVVTGCEYEVDFSFDADNDAAKFGLNDYVYTLKRE